MKDDCVDAYTYAHMAVLSKKIADIYNSECMGRSPDRITPSLKAVEELWSRHPDMRLAQLLWWIAGGIDPFYMEEDRMVDRINEIIRKEDELRGDCCE